MSTFVVEAEIKFGICFDC